MQTISIDEIEPDNLNRQRGWIEDLSSLRTSIKEEGLFHAIIVTPADPEEFDSPFKLVAGFNRLRCVENLAQAHIPIHYNGEKVPLGEIPYTITHKTDEYSLFKIELEENLRREALTPVEQANAISRLRQMLQANAPDVVPGLPKKVTNKEVAQELIEIKGPDANSLETESQNVADAILIDAYKDEPEVKKAKTTSEALRAARRLATREFRELYGTVTREAEVNSPHKVLVGDCQELMPGLPEEHFDVIIADPPYGIGADKFGEQATAFSGKHAYDDSPEAFQKVMVALDQEAHRICKPDAAMFIFMDLQWWFKIYSLWEQPLLTEDDWRPFRQWYLWPTPLFWHKTNRGHTPQPKRGPQRRYETILYALRGNREVRRVGSDILSFSVPDNRHHSAQKPVDLYQELLSWIVYPGDRVLDPCAGVGTTIKAAHALDITATVIEKDAGFASLCREAAEAGEEEKVDG